MFWISNTFWESILPHDCVPLISHEFSHISTEHFNFIFKVSYCHLLRVNFTMFRGHIKDIHTFHRSTPFMWLPLSYLSQWHNRTFRNHSMVQKYYSVCLSQCCQKAQLLFWDNLNKSFCSSRKSKLQPLCCIFDNLQNFCLLAQRKYRVTGHADLSEDSNVVHGHNMYQLESKPTGFSQHNYEVI